MKAISASLTESVDTTYLQTRTTVQGRAHLKTISGNTVLGPPLNRFVDVFTETGQTIAGAVVVTSQGRMFTVTAESGGIASLILHNVDFATGATTYVGRINFNLPDIAATAHTYRSIKAITAGVSGWKVYLTSTGSVAINGGTFLINNLALSDFVPIGFPTIPFATGTDQKAVYFLQDPANIGVGQLQTASVGSLINPSTNQIFVHNGSSGTHQYYVYSTTTAPTYTTASITGNATTDVIAHSGHSFQDNDPIVFTALTGGAGLVVGQVYFVRSSVAGVSYQVSTSSGGAPFNFTTDITAGSVGRAFGTTGSNFVFKTGNLPALSGSLLATDSEDYAVPGHTTNSGQPCAFFATTTNLYLGQLSDLSSGATTWPTLVSANLLGSPSQIVGSSAVSAAWSNSLDRAVYLTNTAIFVMKRVVNSEIDHIFGGLNNRNLEGVSTNVVELGYISQGGFDIQQGYLFLTGTTAGQRGVYVADLRSQSMFDYSYVVTKVMDTPSAILKFLTVTEELYDSTQGLEVFYRTSGFGTITGGWTLLPFGNDLTSIASAAQIQFKIRFAYLGLNSCIPPQLREVFLGYQSTNEISDNWEYSHDDSSPGNPSRVAFRLKKAYQTSVPTLYFRAYDLSDVLVVNHNTVANAERFRYSTDSGANWITLGTIPNTVGTLVRYEFATPPGVSVRPSLRES